MHSPFLELLHAYRRTDRRSELIGDQWGSEGAKGQTKYQIQKNDIYGHLGIMKGGFIFVT
jgi:hypothetical protein